MNDAARAPYMKKYEDKKVQFDKDMKSFIAGGGEVTKKERKRKNGKAKKDPNAPKKPSGGGYGVFLNENRAKIVQSLPAGHKITDVSKAAGVQWKALSVAAKKPYEDKYQQKKGEYAKAMEEYKKKNP